MKQLKFTSVIILIMMTYVCSAESYSIPGWVLIWQDEFNGPRINTSFWGYDLGCSGWGNNEWEEYTDSTDNAFIENGNLVIQAIDTGGGNCGYTSARLITKGKVHYAYGKIEARIKVPYGQGIWPAFWMLGENIDSVGWPQCGEIDIVEMIGGGQGRDNVCVGTAHWDNFDHQSNGNSISLPWPEKLSDSYHIYSIEWNSTSIKWYFDDILYHTLNIGSGMEEFQGKDFFIILNLAVGGNWPGYPDNTTIFPQKMYVDYVRWYQWRE
jgi:beta-glucanase (GH16 family)